MADNYIPGTIVGSVKMHRRGKAIEFNTIYPQLKACLLEPFPTSKPRIELCSSTRGLVVFLDSSSFYWICDPMTYSESHLQESLSGYIKVSKSITPNSNTVIQDHPLDTPAVLSVDNSEPGHQIYYISCPIESEKEDDDEYAYKFHTYCSDSGWEWSAEEISLSSGIIQNTAVSCGTMAYWLTEEWDLVAYDPVTRTMPFKPFELPLADEIVSAQLGVVMGNRLGAVVVRQRLMVLYLLAEDRSAWIRRPYAFLAIQRTNYPTRWNGTSSAIIGAEQNLIICRNLPEPLRFESTVMQVLLVIDKRLFVWQKSNRGHGSTIVYNAGEAVLPRHRFLQAVPFVLQGLRISC